MVDVTRRKMLQTSAVIAVGGIMARQTDKIKAAESGNILENTVKKMKLTDQNGKEFNLNLALQKPCIVVFGYGGCPLCEEITKVVAATQEKMLAKGITNVPIIVISAQPETDRKAMKDYIDKYESAGVKEFLPNENMGNNVVLPRPTSERLLHVLCPPTAKDTQDLERAIAQQAGTDTGLGRSTKQHSRYLAPCMNGEALRAPAKDQGGPYIGASLGRGGKSFEADDNLVETQSTRLVAAIEEMRRPQRRQGVGNGRTP